MQHQEEPNLIDKAKNLTTSVYNWATQDKFLKTPQEELEKRKSICLACPHWDAAAFNNLGKCKLCGCSAGKWYIPSAKCPDNPPKWNSVTVNPVSDKSDISPST
jgi:hypothetical protein